MVTLVLGNSIYIYIYMYMFYIRYHIMSILQLLLNRGSNQALGVIEGVGFRVWDEAVAGLFRKPNISLVGNILYLEPHGYIPELRDGGLCGSKKALLETRLLSAYLPVTLQPTALIFKVLIVVYDTMLRIFDILMFLLVLRGWDYSGRI